MLDHKTILLGVTGSVAAYKAIDIVKGLKEEGASVTVIMTEASKRFITPLSLELASEFPVQSDMWEHPLSHIRLPSSADLFLVAPATANTIGKFAGGLGDDLLSTAMLAFRGPVVLAPAMNWRMYESPAFQENLRRLLSAGVKTVGPERGSLACGEEGIGRMAETEKIVEAVRRALTHQDLSGERVLITAGPTREYVDPIRFLSNRSSGKMGFALAKVARRRGAEVILISGPSIAEPPPDVRLVRVETAKEMFGAVMEHLGEATTVIMAAAVADYTPVVTAMAKLEKTDAMTLNLTKTDDILESVGRTEGRPFTVGFAAETGEKTGRARTKLGRKHADLIVFNNVLKPGAGFDVDTNEVVLIDAGGEKRLPLMSKERTADAILDRVRELKGHGQE